jgi:IS30 family transposase
MIEDGRSIEIRPEVVNKRKRTGDWEGDSIED